MSRQWIADRLRIGSASYVSNYSPVSIISSDPYSRARVLDAESFTHEQVELIAWGEIFNDLEKATVRAQELNPN